MTSMTDNETYNGYKNRETWAFNLHWQNDESLYLETLNVARRLIANDEAPDDYALGRNVVDYWSDSIEAWETPQDAGSPFVKTLRMFQREVGSWWRIDYAEVGAAVRESLGVESGDTAGHDSSVSLDSERDTDNES